MSAPAFEGVKGRWRMGLRWQRGRLRGESALWMMRAEGKEGKKRGASVGRERNDGEREPRRQGRGEQRPAPERTTTTKERHSRGARCCCCSPRAVTSSGLHLAWRHERALNWKSALVHAGQVGAASRQHRTKRDRGRDAWGPTLGGVGGGCETLKDAGGEAGGATGLGSAARGRAGRLTGGDGGVLGGGGGDRGVWARSCTASSRGTT
jgi:hypothetical protein